MPGEGWRSLSLQGEVGIDALSTSIVPSPVSGSAFAHASPFGVPSGRVGTCAFGSMKRSRMPDRYGANVQRRSMRI